MSGWVFNPVLIIVKLIIFVNSIFICVNILIIGNTMNEIPVFNQILRFGFREELITEPFMMVNRPIFLLILK